MNINSKRGLSARMLTSSTGSVGASSRIDTQDCASLKLFVNEASSVIIAAPSRLNGRNSSSAKPSVPTPKFGVIPNFASGTNGSAIANVARFRASASIINRQVAAILPSISAVRLTGRASSGSSEPRSRSPAVLSMARFMPPASSESTQK